ncbi:MAG: 2-C-methyl-D-erythritol 2,4-cyclodiphosphate synthase, partial [Synergistaceae bacterium]|nr:2-C-methyl-D-erythritol 2,4-cyclodiphosphate synthase [Synergistaceae bacterium]
DIEKTPYIVKQKEINLLLTMNGFGELGDLFDPSLFSINKTLTVVKNLCDDRKKLIEALEKKLDAKDEAEAWNEAGHNLIKVDGQRLNFKITWQEDMTMARAIARQKNQKITRTGIGYDVHQLVPERKLILGGIEIKNSPLGLLGHSDADLLTHAIMDAVLGAAGLEDIGNIFPASDEKFKNADSIKLLEEVLRRVKNNGWHIDFIDAVVEAQVPRLNKYRDEIKNNLQKFFDVNIKFKSAETLNDAGRGLSMTCWAAATLTKEL